jgi:hypothetical protein
MAGRGGFAGTGTTWRTIASAAPPGGLAGRVIEFQARLSF